MWRLRGREGGDTMLNRLLPAVLLAAATLAAIPTEAKASSDAPITATTTYTLVPSKG